MLLDDVICVSCYHCCCYCYHCCGLKGTLHQDKMTRPKSSNGAGNRTTTLELYSAFAPTMIERLIEIITAADKAGTQLPDLRGRCAVVIGRGACDRMVI